MSKYKVVSFFDCLVVFDKEEVFLSEGQSLEFDNPKILCIYPTKNSIQKIAFTLNLSDENDSGFYFSSSHNGQRIFFLEEKPFLKNYNIVAIDINGSPCTIEIGERNLCFSYLDNKKEIYLTQDFDKYQTGEISSNCYILLSSSQNQTLVLYNSISGQVKVLEGDQIKIFNNSVIVKKSLDNIARHLIENEYLITPKGISQKNNVIQYQSGRPVIVTNENVIPYAFMEAIEVKDYELASFYLSTPMKHRIDDEHLQEFFGEVEGFYAIDTKTFAVKNQDKKEYYRFTLSDNKISDIENL